MRIVDLFSLASGALLDFARSSIHVHESILFGQLMATLKKGDIAHGGPRVWLVPRLLEPVASRR